MTIERKLSTLCRNYVKTSRGCRRYVCDMKAIRRNVKNGNVK